MQAELMRIFFGQVTENRFTTPAATTMRLDRGLGLNSIQQTTTSSTTIQPMRVSGNSSVSTGNLLMGSAAMSAGVGLQAMVPVSAANAPSMPTILTRMNNHFGQYYLRFLRHHSTRASPVTVMHLLRQ